MTQKHLATWVAALGLGALAACSPSDPSAEAAVLDTSAIVSAAGSQSPARPIASNAPAAPDTRVLNPGRQFSIVTTQVISSRISGPGDLFTGTVVRDVQDAAGRVAIPEGSLVSGMITAVTSALNPGSSGTLTLVVNSVTVRGKNYRLEASVDSLITKDTKRTIVGAAVGATAGASAAAATKDSDIRFPAGTRVILTLTRGLTL